MRRCVLVAAVTATSALNTNRVRDMIDRVLTEEDTVVEIEETSMVSGMFDVAGFDEEPTEGAIGLKLCTHVGKRIALSKEDQTPGWHTVNNANSPFESGKWKSAADGFRFANAEGDQLHCSAHHGSEVNDALLLRYQCSKFDASHEERFAQVASTFWQKCPDDHVPYGWQGQWGDFNFPYYAVCDQGFMGCSYVTSDGYCVEDASTPGAAIHANFGYNDSPTNKPVTLFGWDQFQTQDLLPGSLFYTSKPKSKATVVPGSTYRLMPAVPAPAPASAFTPAVLPEASAASSPPFSVVTAKVGGNEY
jgi:hypothetical protein